MDVKKIGALIAQLRKEKSMTQRELGARLGVSDRAVSKWERGLNLPDAALFEPLARELGVTIPELLRGEREAATAADPAQAVRDTLSLAEYRERQVRRGRAVIRGLAALLVLLVGLPLLSPFGMGLLWGLGPKLDNWRAQQASPDLPVLPGVELRWEEDGRDDLGEGYTADTYVRLAPGGNRGDYFYAPEDGGALRQGDRPLAAASSEGERAELHTLDLPGQGEVWIRLTGEGRGRYEVSVCRWPEERLGEALTLEDGWTVPLSEQRGNEWGLDGREFGESWSFPVYAGCCYAVVLSWGDGNYVEFPFLTE